MGHCPCFRDRSPVFFYGSGRKLLQNRCELASDPSLAIMLVWLAIRPPGWPAVYQFEVTVLGGLAKLRECLCQQEKVFMPGVGRIEILRNRILDLGDEVRSTLSVQVHSEAGQDGVRCVRSEKILNDGRYILCAARTQMLEVTAEGIPDGMPSAVTLSLIHISEPTRRTPI